MACIYRAEHLGLRRQVALKVLTGEVAAGAESRTRFIREARIAAAIKHPSVVDIYDVGVHDDVPFLVMELLVGQDLESFLTASGVPDEGTLLELLIPVVAGLAAVHDAGVVHRDLKPGNIFLSKRSDGALEPRLLDFGISRSFWRNEPRLTAVRQGVLIGTPLYMSPEAMLGREITPQSDQYSLGVVLYECTTGVNPFVANNIAEIVRRVTTGDFTPLGAQPSRPSRRLADIIVRAMSVDPNERFPDMRALGRELMTLSGMRTRLTWGQAFGGGLSSMALVRHEQLPEPPRPAPAPAHRRGSRLLALGAAAVVGGAAFAAGQVLLFRARERPAAPAESAVEASAPAPGAPRSAVAALRPAGTPAASAPALAGTGPEPSPAPVPPEGGAAEAEPEESAARRGAPDPDADSEAREPSRRESATGRGSAATGRRTGPVKGPRRPAPASSKSVRSRVEADQPDWMPTTSPRAPAAAGTSVPDWLPPGASPERPRPAPLPEGDTETGTNDAPILD